MNQQPADPLGIAIVTAETSSNHLEEQGGPGQERLALSIRETSDASASVGFTLPVHRGRKQGVQTAPDVNSAAKGDGR